MLPFFSSMLCADTVPMLTAAVTAERALSGILSRSLKAGGFIPWPETPNRRTRKSSISRRVTTSFGRNLPAAVPRTIPLAARRSMARCAGMPAMSVKMSAHAGATSASTRSTATNTRITCLLWVATIEISVCVNRTSRFGERPAYPGRAQLILSYRDAGSERPFRRVVAVQFAFGLSASCYFTIPYAGPSRPGGAIPLHRESGAAGLHAIWHRHADETQRPTQHKADGGSENQTGPGQSQVIGQHAALRVENVKCLCQFAGVRAQPLRLAAPAGDLDDLRQFGQDVQQGDLRLVGQDGEVGVADGGKVKWLPSSQDCGCHECTADGVIQRLAQDAADPGVRVLHVAHGVVLGRLPRQLPVKVHGHGRGVHAEEVARRVPAHRIQQIRQGDELDRKS